MDAKIAINRLEAGNTAHSRKADYIRLAIDALWKQVPKEPIRQSTAEKTHFKCECGYVFMAVYSDGYIMGHKPQYCEICGQKLDWSDEK